MTGRNRRVEWNARITFLQSVAIAFSVCCTQSDRVTQANRKNAQESVRITQFYATKAALPRGESAKLCYGVENAAAVRITPMIENIRPSLSRCISITPTATSTFTLIAENGETGKISRSVTVTVTEPLPRFTDLSVSAKEVAPGETVAFCFKAKEAIAVKGNPGYFLHGGSPKGDCLVDQPRKKTEYRLTIAGTGGDTADESVTVQVRLPAHPVAPPAAR